MKIPPILRGHMYDMPFATRGAEQDLLGLAVSRVAANKGSYQLEPIVFGFPVNPDEGPFHEALAEFIEDDAERLRAYFNLVVLTQLHPIKAVELDDITRFDSVDSPLFAYLSPMLLTGFRARAFHQRSTYYPVFTDLADTHCEQGQWYNRLDILFKSDGWLLSPFMAIDVSTDIDDQFLLTEVTHIAARLNCPTILKGLIDTFLGPDQKAILSKQDKLSFGLLNGLTAIHHAAHVAGQSTLLAILARDDIEVDLQDKNENTFMHALACSKATPEKQLACFHAVNKYLMETITDPLELKAFYQTKNKDGKTALQLAAEAKNKELVIQLLFVLGADMEPIETHFSSMHIHYGRLLAERIAQVDREIDGLKHSIIELQRQISENTAATAQLRAGMAAQNKVIASQQQMIMLMASALAAGGMMPAELVAGVEPQRALARLAWQEGSDLSEAVPEL